MRRILIVTLTCIAAPASAQWSGGPFAGRPPSGGLVQEDGTALAPMPWLNCATGITCTVDATNKRIDMATTGGAPVPATRTLTTTSPLTCDGGASCDLSANRTLALGTVPVSLGGTGITTVSAGGKLLRASAANTWAASTATYPDTATAGDIIVATGANALGSLAAGGAGTMLQGAGAGTVPAYSTATWPATVAGAGQILRASGANAWAASTVTWPDSVTTGHALWSTALNAWTASANPYWVGAHEWGDAIGGGDAIVLSRDPLGGVGQADSHIIKFLGRSNDGAAHYTQARQFLDVTSNAGAGKWVLQTDVDGAGFTERLSATTAGVIKINNAYTLPTADGAAGTYLQTNGAGAASWAAVTGMPTVAAAGYAAVSSGVDTWVSDQTPQWVGAHTWLVAAGAQGILLDVTAPAAGGGDDFYDSPRMEHTARTDISGTVRYHTWSMYVDSLSASAAGRADLVFESDFNGAGFVEFLRFRHGVGSVNSIMAPAGRVTEPAYAGSGSNVGAGMWFDSGDTVFSASSQEKLRVSRYGHDGTTIAASTELLLGANTPLTYSAGTGSFDASAASGAFYPPTATDNNSGGEGVVWHRITVAAGVTGNVDTVITKKTELVSIECVKTNAAGGGAGTIQFFSGANPITNALSIDVADQTIIRPTTLDDAYTTIAAAGTLRITRTRTASTDETCFCNIIGVLRP